jgi:hypothetical protein
MLHVKRDSSSGGRIDEQFQAPSSSCRFSRKETMAEVVSSFLHLPISSAHSPYPTVIEAPPIPSPSFMRLDRLSKDSWVNSSCSRKRSRSMPNPLPCTVAMARSGSVWWWHEKQLRCSG